MNTELDSKRGKFMQETNNNKTFQKEELTPEQVKLEKMIEKWKKERKYRVGEYKEFKKKH